MMPSELERCAQKVFGEKWRAELPRHFEITPRAMRYWITGEASIPSHVASDLLAWTGPQGHHAFLLAQIKRAYLNTKFEDGNDRGLFFDTLTAWHIDARGCADRQAYLEDRAIRLEKEADDVRDHDLDEALSDQIFHWNIGRPAPDAALIKRLQPRYRSSSSSMV